MNLLFFILISCALIGGVEFAKRKFLLSASITRRMTHIGAALIAAAAPLFLTQKPIVFACLFFAGVIFLSRRTTFLSSIHGVERASFGDVYLPLGEAIAAMIFLPHDVGAFQFGVLVMGISDGLAGLVGERFGKHRLALFGSRKSIEGACTFFVSSMLLTLFFIPGIDYRILVIPFTLTAIEFSLGYGLDNLILPIAGAYLIQALVS